MAFGFAVAQVEDARPACDGFVIRLGQVFVRALQFDFGAFAFGYIADDGDNAGLAVDFDDAGRNQPESVFAEPVPEHGFHVVYLAL